MKYFPQVVIDEIAHKTDWNDHNGSILLLIMFMEEDGIRGLRSYADDMEEIMLIHKANQGMTTGLISQRRDIMDDVMDIVDANYENGDEVYNAF